MLREKIKTAVIAVLALALAVSLAFHAVRQPVENTAAASSFWVDETGGPAATPADRSSSAAPSAVEPVPLPVSSHLEEPPGAEDNIPLEIERKFLVDIEDLPDMMHTPDKSYRIEQTYISISPEIRIRRIGDYQYYFAIKMAGDEVGLARAEIDFMITKEAYEYLVEMKTGNTIFKTRYQFYEGDAYVFLDVYAGDLEGLAVVEVQFESVEAAEAFLPPAWFGPDVTEDGRYKNAQLALNGLPDPRILG